MPSRASALERLLHSSRSRSWSLRLRGPALATLLMIAVAAIASAQTGASGEQKYDRAAALPSGPQRISSLEDVIRSATGTLRTDALQLLVWEYAHVNPNQAATAARELLGTDPGNPIALAVLNSGAPPPHPDPKRERQRAESLAQALQKLSTMRQPRSVSEVDFASIRRWAYSMLSGSTGIAYLNAKDYESARPYLRNALAISPADPRYTYALALADLDGNNPNPEEGYRLLAKSVVLSDKTPEGRQIAQFAGARYGEAGGTAADWQRFLAAARADTSTGVRSSELPQLAIAVESPPADASDTSKFNKTAAKVTQGERKSVEKSSASSKPPPRKDQGQDRAVEEALSREPMTGVSSAPAPELQKPQIIPFPPGEPVSLGILIEASVKKESQGALVQALSNVVRRLRPKDEAFILAFGDQLAFEQDLTQNYRLLERAVDSIKPEQGTALFDAVGFSAGHLKRIARNRNQVLLVISDGRNESSRQTSLQLASEINDVKIYCIGLGVDAADGRYTLETLARHTGGQVAYISEPSQFERAVQQLASAIYGPFPLGQSR